MKLLSVEEAAAASGLHPNTIRNWADAGKIYSIRTKGGHRRVDISEFLIPGTDCKPEKHTVCYCRVSSYKQKDDLERQVSYMQEKYPEAEIVKDIGSGLNFKRKGLRRILERLLQGEIVTLVVAHRDRLARFGSDLIEYLINKNGGKFLVLNEVSLSPEQELTRDLLTVLHVFSCRLHGLRKYKDKISEDKDLSRQESDSEAEAMAGNS